jgi:hypothetical protein
MASKLVQFKIDAAGQNALVAALGAGLDEFATVARDRIRQYAPPASHRHYRKDYRSSILSATYVNGQLVHGRSVREYDPDGGRPVPVAEVTARGATGPSIVAVIYTKNPLGHLIELGTQPHDIPITVPTLIGTRTVTVHHPGAKRHPHFALGLLSALGDIGPAMARGAASQLKETK